MSEHHPYQPKRGAEPSPPEEPSDDTLVLDAITEALRTSGPAFAAWAEFHDADPDMLALFGAHYIDHFSSLEDLGARLVGDERERLKGIGSLAPYVSIDYKALAEDQLSAADCIALPAPAGGFYLFRGPDGHTPELDTN